MAYFLSGAPMFGAEPEAIIDYALPQRPWEVRQPWPSIRTRQAV